MFHPKPIIRRLFCASTVLLVGLATADVAHGQLRRQLPGQVLGQLRGETRGQQRVQAEAVPGKPFGVGVLEVQVPLGQRLAEPVEGQVTLTEKSGRISYPAFESRPAAQAVRNLIGRRRMTVFFLFTGDAPLDVTLSAGVQIRQVITPRASANGQQLFGNWWREFARPDPDDLYPQVQGYLTATLARRLGLKMPAPSSPLLGQSLSSQLSLLSGAESSRWTLEQQILVDGAALEEPLDIALPPLPPLASQTPEVVPAEKPAIEPIALRVPEECFYVRMGNFNNFLWFRRRLEGWGGDTRNMLSEQAVDYGLNKRFEQQIATKESALAALLGPTVIADVALIGTDTFLREGAAMGILFQARSSTALSLDIQKQRSETLKATAGAREEKLTIAGKPVSLVSTPDNRVRSFYVADGDFHLVTTSRALVERFLQTGAVQKDQPAGQGSLGLSAEFQYARTNVPADRGDTIFVYLSRSFFRNLMSPQYQVEMRRRLQSAVEMDLVMLAQALARSERRPESTLAELVAADLLPSWFGKRVDGSRLEERDGELFDSLRGGRGSFLPIPDVAVDKISRSELDAYSKFVSAANDWGNLDPVLVAFSHADSERLGLERVSLDIEAAPLSPRNIETLNKWLGPPAPQRLVPVPGDLVNVQASVRGGGKTKVGDHYLFFGLRDLLPGELPSNDRPLLEALKVVVGQSTLRGYLGAWPEPGLLSYLGGTSDIPSDPNGYSRLRTGVWRRIFDQYTVLSFNADVLEQVTPQLAFEASPSPVQVVLRVEDLQGTNLAAWVNREGYERAAKMSAGNMRLLTLLTEQFNVSPENCLAEAETILDGKLLDPLGGQYVLSGDPRTGRRWTSSKSAAGMPGGYQFPALTWIRGLDAQAWFDTGRLVLHGEVDMPAQVVAGAAAVKAPPVKSPAGGAAAPAPNGNKPGLPSLKSLLPGFLPAAPPAETQPAEPQPAQPPTPQPPAAEPPEQLPPPPQLPTAPKAAPKRGPREF